MVHFGLLRLGMLTTRVKIAAAGGIESILNVLDETTSAQHEAVQEMVVKTLKSLATGNADNKVKIAAAGGIESILNAMKQHANHESVQEYGCYALRNLAGNAGQRSKNCRRGWN